MPPKASKTPDFLTKTATFSPCRTYRYELTRGWDPAKPVCVFLMLNPSTADENELDPTIRRCVSFANAWGHGSLVVLNIFAFRSTDPHGMFYVEDPIGPRNDEVIREWAARPGMTWVGGWGIHGMIHDRGKKVARMLTGLGVKLKCLGVTQNGHPSHPLYLKSSTELRDFPIESGAAGDDNAA